MKTYYVELAKYFPNEVFRLQKDKISWRKVQSKELKECDFITNDAAEIIGLQLIDSEIEINGKKFKVNPKSHISLSEDELFYEIKVKRSSYPGIPKKQQMISVIRNGSDEIDNTLVLNTDGIFELRDLQSINLAIKDPTIVVRYAGFCAGLDYVGEAASKDKEFIDEMYVKALHYWIWHIQGSCTNYFYDWDEDC
jgi:hypothetical protein